MTVSLCHSRLVETKSSFRERGRYLPYNPKPNPRFGVRDGRTPPNSGRKGFPKCLLFMGASIISTSSRRMSPKFFVASGTHAGSARRDPLCVRMQYSAQIPSFRDAVYTRLVKL